MNSFGQHEFKPGEVIFSEGDSNARCAYLVGSGKIVITKKSPSGPKILGYVGQGGIFGEMALIDHSSRMAEAKAVEASTVIVIDEGRLDQKLHRADPFVRRLFEILVRDIRELSEKVTA